MSLTQIQQIHQLLKDKKHILIVFRKDGEGDAIASAAALALFLEKINKPAEIVSDGFLLADNFKFLKKTDQIKTNLDHLQKFIITLDTAKSGLQQLSYNLKDNQLQIFITPKQGSFSEDDLSTSQTDFKYDLIFTVNTPDLESLGEIYKNNTEFFFKTEIINIDHQSRNERYGQINLVETTNSSTAETILNLIEQLGAEYIDAEIATTILTGIIAQTHSFRTDFIKPHTLGTAGKLMNLGADKEKIIENLYRTRTITTLKLWGHVLTNLKSYPELKLVWSTITRDNFVRCGAKESDLKDVIEELIHNSPEAKIILLLHEHSGYTGQVSIVHGILNTAKNYDAINLMENYSPVGAKNHVSFVLEGRALKEAEDEVLNYILIKLKEIK